MTANKKLKNIIVRLFLFSAFVILFSGCAKKNTVVLYHIGDVRGAFEANKKSKKNIGGFAVLKNILKKEKKEFILLNSGNWFLGTPEGSAENGKYSVYLMNIVNTFAASLGIMDFKFGVNSLKEIIKKAKFSIIGTNIYKRGTTRYGDFVSPYKIKQINGVKIGVLGLISENLRTKSLYKNMNGYYIADEVKSAKRAIKELKKKGVKFIVAMIQEKSADEVKTSFLYAKNIASKVKGLDVIILGGNNMKTAVPVIFSDTLIVQTGADLNYVGRLEIDIGSLGKKPFKYKYKLIELNAAKFKEDESTLNFISFIKKQTAKIMDKKIGYTRASLTHSAKEQSLLGSWICDCVLKWSKKDAVLLRSKDIHAYLNKGNITKRDLYRIFPYNTNLVRVKLKGKHLRNLLQKNLIESENHIQIAGLKVFYNKDKEIERVLIKDSLLNESVIYTIMISENMLCSDDAFYSFEFANTYDDVRSKLLWCMWKEKTLNIPNTKRWISADSI